MTGPSVRVIGLGKRFRIGTASKRHNTLRDAITDGLRRGGTWVRRGFRRQDRSKRHFWALREVDFEVAPGEAVGIIGANGAGKSTLLKILSRITPPTEGRVEIRGRVGCLLEVGTGFHSELTGRENTYLSGAILGMGREEIDRKFDEIVAFAGVEPFIDTPVKHFSSGMYLRLAFSVAAHLEPEILIVDEVLAVGDAEFQRKCLGKMEDVTRKEGRTVLFVSHNMSAVQRLCDRCILLRSGRIEASGKPREVIGTYLAGAVRESRPGTWIGFDGVERKSRGHLRFTEMCYGSGRRETDSFLFTGGPLQVELAVEAGVPTPVGSLGVTIYDAEGTKLVNADTAQLAEPFFLSPGRNRLELLMEALHLNPGVYTLGLWLADQTMTSFDDIPSAVEIEVVPAPGSARHQKKSDALIPCSFRIRHRTGG